MSEPLHTVVGLDLGQVSDFTALAVLQWPMRPPRNPSTNIPPPPFVPPEYLVPTLKRFPLGTPYTEISQRLVKFLRESVPGGAVLAVDQTGVGRPVCEMICRDMDHARLPGRGGFVGVTITSGHEVTLPRSAEWHVPKKTLVSVLQVLLQTRRLHVAPESPMASTLVKELETFKVKVTTAGNEVYETWRERDHDDLVLAVAIAVWAAETLDWFRGR